jgi:uncharacterized membrane protein YphA (DoxX/SURF4 family)
MFNTAAPARFRSVISKDAGMNPDISTSPSSALWRRAAILFARLIFTAIFAMAVSFKFSDIGATSAYIAAAGFPQPTILAWLAAILECLLALAFLTGAFFREASLIAGFYVVFLAFAFHGPRLWAGNQMEFGFFVDHFTFLAGLLFAAVHGPGRVLAINRGLLKA